MAGGYRKTNPIFSFNKKYHQCERMRFRVIRRRIEGIGWNRIEPTGGSFSLECQTKLEASKAFFSYSRGKNPGVDAEPILPFQSPEEEEITFHATRHRLLYSCFSLGANLAKAISQSRGS